MCCPHVGLNFRAEISKIFCFCKYYYSIWQNRYFKGTIFFFFLKEWVLCDPEEETSALFLRGLGRVQEGQDWTGTEADTASLRHMPPRLLVWSLLQIHKVGRCPPFYSWGNRGTERLNACCWPRAEWEHVAGLLGAGFSAFPFTGPSCSLSERRRWKLPSRLTLTLLASPSYQDWCHLGRIWTWPVDHSSWCCSSHKWPNF